MTLLDFQIDSGAEDTAKPSLEQLAKRHGLSMNRIMEIYEQFKTFLPEGQECNYPDEPAHLTKESIQKYFAENQPEMEEEEFEDLFAVVDFDGGGEIEFDEFLDFGFKDDAVGAGGGDE